LAIEILLLNYIKIYRPEKRTVITSLLLVFKVFTRYGHGHGKINLKEGIVAKGGLG
jgi:hypothetical protein